MKIFKELVKWIRTLLGKKEDKPSKPETPNMTSDELMAHIKNTATPASFIPDVTRYVFKFKGGIELTFDTFVQRDIWGWQHNSGGVNGSCFITTPAGQISRDINHDVRHQAHTQEPVKLPSLGTYVDPWKTWNTVGGKTLYFDEQGVDTSVVTTIEALKHLIDITTEMTSVTATILMKAPLGV